MSAQGPLAGMRILEFAGIGPGPFAGMHLADLGADILRIERPETPDPTLYDFDARGRQTIALDLKNPRSVALCLALCQTAEAVIEGFRPGVMERLGLGPDAMLACNPALVYGRITGWGQSGPLSQMAGHDINYLAITGALAAIGTKEKPVAPLNLVADYGGGAMFLVTGILAAIIHARATGQGQVVDAAMSDGAAYLMTPFYGLHAAGHWQDRRAVNIVDGGSHFYDAYECADGQWIAIGAIEPQFYGRLVEELGISEATSQAQLDPDGWPRLHRAFEEKFRSRTRAQWIETLQSIDACFSPVLSLEEAPAHPHNLARSTFLPVGTGYQPAPAPRLSVTRAVAGHAPSPIGTRSHETLKRWGVEEALVTALFP